MSDLSCQLCGSQIPKKQSGPVFARKSSAAWNQRVRVVYTLGYLYGQAQLSPTGYFDHGTWRPWESEPDTDGAQPQQYISASGDPRTPNAWWGAFIHDACWDLLKLASDSHEFELGRLLEILYAHSRQLPSPNDVIEYKYLFRIRNEDPTCRNLLDSPLSACIRPRTIREESHASSAVENSSSASASPSIPSGDRNAREEFAADSGTSHDCFSRLPPEIHNQILSYLKDCDVLDLRVASREVHRTHLAQKFFESRFHRVSTYGCVTEARTRPIPKDFYCDWRTLFTLLRAIKPPEIYRLHNRQRIWEIATDLADLVCPYKDVVACGEVRLFQPSTGVRVSCDSMVSGRELFDLDKMVYVDIGVAMRELHASFVGWKEETYLVGLRFVSSTGKQARLGFVLPGREQTLKLTTGDEGLKDRDITIRGLKVGSSFHGLSGLAVYVNEREQPSSWLGSEGKKQRDLWVRFPLNSIRCALDGYKIKSLGFVTAPEAE